MVRLHKNEYLFPHCQAIRKLIAAYNEDSLRYYPAQDQQVLHKTLADYYHLPSSFFFVGSGLEHVLSTLLARIMIHVGYKTLIVGDPSWKHYETIASENGYRDCVKFSLLTQQNRITGSTDVLRKMVEPIHHAVVLFGLPNNPTGHILDEEATKQIIVDYPNHLFLLDEAYAGFDGNPYNASSFLPFLPKQENVLILRSFSKFFGLAGMRIGYAIGNPRLLQQLKLDPSYLGLNSIAMDLSIAAISNSAFYQKQAHVIRVIRNRFIKKINHESAFHAYQSAANFVLVRCNKNKSAMPIAQRLERYGFLVKTFENDTLRDYLRITIAPQKIMDDVYHLLLWYAKAKA